MDHFTVLGTLYDAFNMAKTINTYVSHSDDKLFDLNIQWAPKLASAQGMKEPARRHHPMHFRGLGARDPVESGISVITLMDNLDDRSDSDTQPEGRRHWFWIAMVLAISCGPDHIYQNAGELAIPKQIRDPPSDSDDILPSDIRLAYYAVFLIDV